MSDNVHELFPPNEPVNEPASSVTDETSALADQFLWEHSSNLLRLVEAMASALTDEQYRQVKAEFDQAWRRVPM